MDGSVIYGSDPARAAALRTFSLGKLKTSSGNLMPLNTGGVFPNANDAHLVPDAQLFLGGDVRANENVELTSVHTLFLREHNQIAAAIAQRYPSMSDEEIYQRARMIVVAELQVITYKEFLPALLGGYGPSPYLGYNSNVNSGIANEFSTAAYRFGHSIVNDDVEFLDSDGNDVRPEIPLAQAFFNPATINEVGVDPILKYLSTDDAQEVDLKIVDGLRNFLFGPPGAGGFDLIARNVQRGRDHGLADYNTVRRAYGLPMIVSFSQITKNTDVQNKLRTLYGSVNNIDLIEGGLAEDHVSGGSVGPTFARIIADQFARIRDGDRFWYQRVFSGRDLMRIEQTRLSDVIRRNTTITKLEDNVFQYDEVNIKMSTQGGSPPYIPTFGPLGELRTLDGSGNNQSHPLWGSAGVDLLRKSQSAYADGLSAPAGGARPSARLISNVLNAQTGSVPNSRFMSDWVYEWGQFIDHDLDLTDSGSVPFNISVPTGDPYFDPTSTGTQIIPLMRSNFDPSTGF